MDAQLSSAVMLSLVTIQNENNCFFMINSVIPDRQRHLAVKGTAEINKYK